MADIAVLGYGTVGSGVVEVFDTNHDSINKKALQPINVKYVLDLRDFDGDPIQEKIVHDYERIVRDPQISIVVEVMGGIEPAYTYVKRALLAGKSVVTSNKELVAAYGAELLAIAKEKNINFLFEASVGGGIPIIRPLNQSLTADEIFSIYGVLNGTTNYILTQMDTHGAEFSEALAEAQQKGYAERNPKADVEGHDSCRKIAILSSLAFGMQVDYQDIYTEGITEISNRDMEYARALNSGIKLLAMSKKIGKKVFARVAPVLLPRSHPLSVVSGVKNAIFIKGNVIGDVMFYGSGAGKLPTASAVVADVIEAVKNLDRNIIAFWSTEKMTIMEFLDAPVKALVRVTYKNREAAQALAGQLFGAREFMSIVDGEDKEFGFVTVVDLTERELNERLCKLKDGEAVEAIAGVLRMEPEEQV